MAKPLGLSMGTQSSGCYIYIYIYIYIYNIYAVCIFHLFLYKIVILMFDLCDVRPHQML